MSPPDAAQPAPVRVIAISSGKGGVGKTNVSVNLAVSNLPAFSLREPAKDIDYSILGVLDRLEGRGLLYRRRDEQDRRKSWLHLDPAGHDRPAALLHARQDAYDFTEIDIADLPTLNRAFHMQLLYGSLRHQGHTGLKRCDVNQNIFSHESLRVDVLSVFMLY